MKKESPYKPIRILKFLRIMRNDLIGKHGHIDKPCSVCENPKSFIVIANRAQEQVNICKVCYIVIFAEIRDYVRDNIMCGKYKP